MVKNGKVWKPIKTFTEEKRLFLMHHNVCCKSCFHAVCLFAIYMYSDYRNLFYLVFYKCPLLHLKNDASVQCMCLTNRWQQWAKQLDWTIKIRTSLISRNRHPNQKNTKSSTHSWPDQWKTNQKDFKVLNLLLAAQFVWPGKYNQDGEKSTNHTDCKSS